MMTLAMPKSVLSLNFTCGCLALIVSANLIKKICPDQIFRK